MMMRKNLTRGSNVIQWITVVLALAGFVYNGYKDYSNGLIKPLTNNTQGVESKKPIQYCLMAYDPNIDRIFYQHENGQWYDQPPQIRKHSDQSQEALGTGNGPQRTPQYAYGRPSQAEAYTQRY